MEQEGLNYGWEWENRLKEKQHTEKTFICHLETYILEAL